MTHNHNFSLVFMQSNRYPCQILMKLEFSGTDFQKNTAIQNFVKIRQIGAELFNADGQTHDETSSCSSQFYEGAQ
jgi:hypothetical protein